MSGEYCVDANVFITAWNERYPLAIFPTLWRELANHQENIVLIKPIYEEIDSISQSDKNKSDHKKKYPLRTWLIEARFIQTPIDEQIEEKSLLLEKKYEIEARSKGADQNDITLIAYAKVTDKTVVTLERTQKQPPQKKSNYKIPLICSEQEVKCITFIEMLRRLGVRI